MEKRDDRGVISFLETTIDKEKLRNALEVIRDFKRRESSDEWIYVAFAAWTKLEQLEEYLEFLVNGEKLKDDTVAVANQKNIKLK